MSDNLSEATRHGADASARSATSRNDTLESGVARVFRSRHFAWRVGYLIAACGIFFADQATKAWAVTRLRTGAIYDIVPNFMSLAYAENPGIAFGQFQNGGNLGRFILIALAGIAALGVLIYFVRTSRNDDRVLGACALLVAGILGNVADRVRFGFVIDFIDVHFRGYHYPTFNIADMSICIGAGLLFIDAFLSAKKESKNPEVRMQESE